MFHFIYTNSKLRQIVHTRSTAHVLLTDITADMFGLYTVLSQSRQLVLQQINVQDKTVTKHYTLHCVHLNSSPLLTTVQLFTILVGFQYNK